MGITDLLILSFFHALHFSGPLCKDKYHFIEGRCKCLDGPYYAQCASWATPGGSNQVHTSCNMASLYRLMRTRIIKHTEHKRETTVHLELISSINFFKVLHVCALTDSSHIKTTNVLMIKLYSLHTVCYNSDKFRPIVLIFRELLNISKVYIRTHILQAPCVLFIGQAFHYSPENAFYIFNQQIYFIT